MRLIHKIRRLLSKKYNTEATRKEVEDFLMPTPRSKNINLEIPGIGPEPDVSDVNFDDFKMGWEDGKQVHLLKKQYYYSFNVSGF